MLTCIYHPIDGMIVVEDDEAERLKSTGVWFDSPSKARDYRDNVEAEIKVEALQNNETAPKQKGKRK